MDYGNSQFTAVDVMDLLPSDFEETAVSDSTSAKQKKPAPYHYDNNQQPKRPPIPTATTTEKTLFTPMHPNLSLKLQNTTTPVINSSTLDSGSSMMLSQIDEGTHEEDLTISVNTNTTSTMTFETGEEDFTTSNLEVEQFLINPEEDVTPEVKHRKLLPNLDFYQVNVIDAKLPFEDNHFDFVMQRLVTASFTVSDWKNVMAELVRVTKPGGYIQLLEIDYNTFNLGPNGRKWESTRMYYIVYLFFLFYFP